MSSTTSATVPSSTQTSTLIIVILDESGSMSGQVSNIIGGFNTFLSEQRLLKSDKGRLVLLKFNGRVMPTVAPLDLVHVPELTRTTYNPGGGTALYDAVKEGIRLGELHKLPEERVLVLIMTDGEENSSTTSSLEVKNLISSHEALGNWTFTYIGVSPEVWAATMGQQVSNTAQYNFANQKQNFVSAAQAATALRVTTQAQQIHGLFDSFSTIGPTLTFASAILSVATTTIKKTRKTPTKASPTVLARRRPRNPDGTVKIPPPVNKVFKKVNRKRKPFGKRR